MALLSGDEDFSYAGLKDKLRNAVADDPMDATLTTVMGAAILFFIAERDTNPRVNTLADALEFTSTAMSVGYSNFFPETEAGKLIASAMMTAGPSLAATFLDPPGGPPAVRGRAAVAAASQRSDEVLGEKLDAILEELRAQRQG
jgi:voltage-gated potassium channel Kch